MGIGATIKSLLNAKKMTVKQLAENTGIPINTLYSITKRDCQNVRSDNLSKIASALGVNPNYLLFTDFFDAVGKDDGSGIDYYKLRDHLASKGIVYTDDRWKELEEWSTYTDKERELISAQRLLEYVKDIILACLDKLNKEGLSKAAERIENLTFDPRYKKEE